MYVQVSEHDVAGAKKVVPIFLDKLSALLLQRTADWRRRNGHELDVTNNVGHAIVALAERAASNVVEMKGVLAPTPIHAYMHTCIHAYTRTFRHTHTHAITRTNTVLSTLLLSYCPGMLEADKPNPQTVALAVVKAELYGLFRHAQETLGGTLVWMYYCLMAFPEARLNLERALLAAKTRPDDAEAQTAASGMPCTCRVFVTHP